MFEIRSIKVDGQENAPYIDNALPIFCLMADTDKNNERATACRLVIKDSNGNLFWDSGEMTDADIAHVAYAGSKLCAFTTYEVVGTIWNTAHETAEYTGTFTTGKLGRPWNGKWITHPSLRVDSKTSPPVLKFENDIDIQTSIQAAYICITALGIYTLEINQVKIGDFYLAPGFSSYKHRMPYQIYDITQILRAGKNNITANVAGGWAVGNYGALNHTKNAAPKQALLMELHVFYQNGEYQIFGTNEQWLVSADGPVRMASLYDGEYYDARIESARLRFEKAVPFKFKGTPKFFLSNHLLPRQVRALMPKSSHQGRKGMIYDFGQNMAGIIKIKFQGTDGQKIVIRHAEVLMDGELFTKPLRSAKAQITYVCKDGLCEYIPHFTYMGFRYIEIQGMTEEQIKANKTNPGLCKSKGTAPISLEITALAISSIVKTTGTFECSNAKINRLQENIVWSGLGNFISIPTDCPQRDERLGWTGDIAVFAPTACFQFDVKNFLQSWMQDLCREQGVFGGIPFIVPQQDMPVKLCTAGWGDACILVPWANYMDNGDINILKESYPSMCKFLKGRHATCTILAKRGRKYICDWDWGYGDWLSPEGTEKDWKRQKPMVSTAYFANSCNIMYRIAKILGKEKDAKIFRRWFLQSCDAYKTILTDKNGRLKEETQTGYVCPLVFRMLSDNDAKLFSNRLISMLEKSNCHLTTGFLGTPYLLFALSDFGCPDKAYELLLQETCPSWLYEINAGATTIWERWDALRPDGTVNYHDENDGHANMVSFNHYANGAVGAWLYQRVAGITPLEAGYRHFQVKPIIGGGLAWVSCQKETPYGTIEVRWEINDTLFTLYLNVPFHTTAVVELPDKSTMTVGSGHHEFHVGI